MSLQPEDPAAPPTADGDATAREVRGLLVSEDWWAVWIGGGILLSVLAAILVGRIVDPSAFEIRLAEIEAKSEHAEAEHRRVRASAERTAASLDDAEAQAELASARSDARAADKAAQAQRIALNPVRSWIGKPGGWDDSPLEALGQHYEKLAGILGAFALSLVLFGIGTAAMARAPATRTLAASGSLISHFARFVPAFAGVFLFALLAYALAGQAVVKHYNLEYALWALVVGLLISNTIGTPEWLKPAVRTEFYIKTGLVLLGAEILLGQLVVLGVPGICVAWVVTPIVLVSTYQFGQRVLGIRSRSLNMVISADMSVCGVSAAIATAAACRAKKEELSLAIGMSLTFTVVMMVLMPAAIRALGMSDVLGGAWMGGTIDSTGAVAAAGGILGETALAVAATVKMIQNILIGVIAFAVAVYWVTKVDPIENGETTARPRASEIWRRFPKFVLGFVAASLVFSLVHGTVAGGPAIVDATIDGTTKTLRGWFFCLAFVSIGLETNFKELAAQLQGGKPLVLYLVGQTFNLCLTLAMASLMFEVIFRDAVATLLSN
ncbi:MAG: putative sulfate exporter family transporter [Planctomycetaceae bacterium]